MVKHGKRKHMYIVNIANKIVSIYSMELSSNSEPEGYVKDVQSFLGFGNFYRRFIKSYSEVTNPLTKLTRKEIPFKWTEAQQTAFDELKVKFSSTPVLTTFDPEKQITLETDASDFAIGACLSQPDENNKLHPVAYYSRTMSPAELNYDIHDKELLAIVVAFEQWKVYLEGGP